MELVKKDDWENITLHFLKCHIYSFVAFLCYLNFELLKDIARYA